MPIVSLYGDVEAMLIGWLPPLFTPAPRAGVATPADPASTGVWCANGFAKINRIGGPGRYGIETARVNVETFGPNYGAASDFARLVRTAFETRLIGHSAEGCVVLNVETTSAPSWVPYDDVHVTRFLATYTLSVHSQ